MSNTASVSVISPVTAESLAQFLGLPYTAITTDALLDPYILTACEYFVSNTNHDLVSREWTLRLDSYPVDQHGRYEDIITLPISPATSITSIEIDSVAYTAFTSDLYSRPNTITFDDVQSGGIVIVYEAGYADAASTPASIKMAIMLMAGYIYDNRGCSLQMAWTESGAKILASQYKMYIGGL